MHTKVGFKQKIGESISPIIVKEGMWARGSASESVDFGTSKSCVMAQVWALSCPLLVNSTVYLVVYRFIIFFYVLDHDKGHESIETVYSKVAKNIYLKTNEKRFRKGFHLFKRLKYYMNKNWFAEYWSNFKYVLFIVLHAR